MEQQQQHIAALISRYWNGQATPAEQHELQQWIGASDANAAFYQSLMNSRQLSGKMALFQSFNPEKGWNTLLQQIPGLQPAPQPKAVAIKKLYPYAAVAAMLLMAALVWLFTTQKQTGTSPTLAGTKPAAVQPGGNRATLTLGNGRVVALDSATGTIQEGGIPLIHLGNGQLSYAATDAAAGATETVEYNVLKTPPGGQYRLILPDGSQVWLNAASSLRFPTRFSGAQRNVSLEGEAFFDIAPDAAAPFQVATGQMQVQVLGTSFNCMSYADEPAAEITLVTGKIQVGTENLLPGQQARRNNTTGTFQLKSNVSIDDIIAWKNGQFRFQEADIQTVLRQIGRWYNLEIVYEGNISAEKFTGEIPRNSSIEELTRILQLSNIRFTIQKGKMIVKA